MHRRTFLAGSACVLLAAGCTTDADVEPGPGRRDPDERLRVAVADSERALLAGYSSVLAAHPDLSAQLGALVSHHRDHLVRVTGEEADATPADATPTSGSPSAGSPSAGASSPTSGPPQGLAPTASDLATARAALGFLRTAERRARAQRIEACDAAVSAALARDLVLIAASEDQHATRLATLLADLPGAAGGTRG